MTKKQFYEKTKKIYPNNEELINDIAKAYQDIIRQFYDAGFHNLQLYDCTWGSIVGDIDKAKLRYEHLNMNLE